MSLPPIICANCGHMYDLPEHLTHGPCIACGTSNCRPQAEGESLDKLQRATRLRLEGSYDEALRCYEHVLVDYDDEHTALWGKLLCQYGVEFVADPKTGVRHATVHMPRRRPMQLHGDFKRACDLAPEEVRAQYEADADYVDEALAEINRHKESSPPYDVFICHKTTHLTGPGYTEDYNRGVQLTMLLTARGYRVFFAPLSGLTPGASYEAGIYYALWSAKVMLLISSDPAFLTSPWVKSEWSRYLDMLDAGEDKHLIPLMYDRLAENRMPREIRLRGLQSIRMDSDLDAKDKLLAAMEKYAGKAAVEQPVPVQPVQTAAKPVKPAAPAPAPAPQPAPRPASAEKPAVKKTAPAKSASAPVPQPQPAPRPASAEKPAVKAVRPADDAEHAISAPTSHFETAPADGGVAITKYTGSGGEVVIPAKIGGKQVVEIGTWAFKNCRDLTRVQLPEGLRRIAWGAFKDNWELTGLNIPASVRAIADLAFDGCPRLTLRVYENSVGHRHALEKKLRAELITPVVPSAPETHFEVTPVDGGVSITKYTGPGGEVTIPATIGGKPVVEIGRDAFEKCQKLTKAVIPGSVKRIGVSAFSGCGLTEITIPEGVTHIGGLAFSGCPITEVHIPASVTSIDVNPFVLCKSLRTITLGQNSRDFSIQNNVLLSSSGTLISCPCEWQGGVYTVPPGVKSIGGWAFFFCANVKGVRLPEGVTSIGSWAFTGCSSLEEAQLPESLQTIESMAFKGCLRLMELTIPRGVTHIGKEAFMTLVTTTFRVHENSAAHKYVRENGMRFEVLPAAPAERRPRRPAPARDDSPEAGFRYEVTGNGVIITRYTGNGGEVKIPESIGGNIVREIGPKAFENCQKLTKAVIPVGVERIGEFAFEKCSALETVNIPLAVKYLGSGAFKGCRSLQKVYVPEGIGCIEAELFSGCAALKEMTLPHGVKSIGGAAFKDCTALERIFLPDGLENIGYVAFDSCGSLKQAVIPEGVTGIGAYAFYLCKCLTDVTIPASVRQILPHTFHGCTSLKNLVLPRQMPEIGIQAFEECPLPLSTRMRLKFAPKLNTEGARTFIDTPYGPSGRERK